MEQLENAEEYLNRDTDKQQPIPAELLVQADDRCYDSFTDLCGAHRRFHEEGKEYIGVKIGEQFALFPNVRMYGFNRDFLMNVPINGLNAR